MTAEMGVVRIAVTMVGPGQGAPEAVPVPVVHDRPSGRRTKSGPDRATQSRPGPASSGGRRSPLRRPRSC